MPIAAPKLPPHREIVSFSITPKRPRASPLTRSLLFALLLATLVGGLHVAIHTGLRQVQSSSFGVINRVVNGEINAEIVITGSSRAWVHYDPRILAAATGLTAYNLGRNGSQTDLQLALLKSYLTHNKAPRLIVHNLDLYAFATSHEIYDPAQYLPYLGEAPIYQAISRVYPDAWKWKYLPLYGYLVPDTRFTWLLGLKRAVGIEPPEDHAAGFVARPWAWTEDFESFRRAHPEGFRTAYEAQGVRDLEELLRLCRDRGIRVLLVYSPEYYEIFPLQLNRPQIFRRFHELSRRYDVPLWDYSDTPLSRSRSYFYNSQHLNSEGASAFSQALAQRLSSFEVKTTLLAPKE